MDCRRSLTTAAVLIASFLFAANAGADDVRHHTLRGIKSVEVIVELLGSAEADGLSVSRLQTDVELRLRQSGIRIVSLVDADAVVHVVVSLLKSGIDPIYAVSASLEVLQWVQLLREASIRVRAATWSSGHRIGFSGSERIRDYSVQQLVDEFMNAYLAENPKP